MKKLNRMGATLLVLTLIGCGIGKAQGTGDSFSSLNLSELSSNGVLQLSGPDIASFQTFSGDELAALVAVLDATPTIPASDLPVWATCWSLQTPSSPPDPGDVIGVGVWPMADGSYLLNDWAFDYGISASPMGMHAMDGSLIPGGTNDGGAYPDGGPSYTPPSYGTNLWIAQWNLSASTMTGIASNTLADVEYELQWSTNLALTNWTSLGFIYGSEITNWTALIPQSVVWTNNGFLRLRSWQSSDGSGLPDWWEALYGLTNVDPNALDSAGDGWTIYQKYELGVAPGTWVTPAAPQDLDAVLNSANVVTLTWLPSSGPVTNYLITKYDWQTEDTTTFNEPPGTTFLTDNLSGDEPLDLSYIGPAIYVNYSAMAQYANGNSGTATATLGEESAPNVSVVRDAQDRLNLYVNGLPANVTGLNVYRQQDQLDPLSSIGEDLYTGAADYFFDATSVADPLSDGYFEIPLSNFTNGLWLIPTNEVTPFGSYNFWVQGELANGTNTDWSENYVGDDVTSADPFIDARQQLKDNLRFILRATGQYSPFTFGTATSEGEFILINEFQWPTNYVYASCYYSGVKFSSNYRPNFYYSPSRPIEDNYALRNFAYDPNALGANGLLNTGIYSSDSDPYSSYSTLFLSNSPAWSFDVNTLLGSDAPTVPPSVLGTNQTQWIYQTLAGSPLGSNYYGLPYSTVLAVTTNNDGQIVSTIYLPNAPGDTSLVQYYQVTQPEFSTAGYYFARPQIDPMPEQLGFATTNVTPLLIQSVGSQQKLAGYAKLAVQNGTPGLYGYLGQYFAQAYEVDTNGNATTNTTGILSPYGNFFATQPGEAALTTMPDVDTGIQGTCTVYCVSLNVDKNHDGTMDTTFNGPDSTSINSPFVFWCNNNFDRWDDDFPFGTMEQDSLESATCPYTISTVTPDCNYLYYDGTRVIPCTRDLEDFARLWISGVTPALLTALPAGSTITLNWGDQGNPNPNNPTIDLFQAADADGGIGYLTNETTAGLQIESDYHPYIGRLGPGNGLVLTASQFGGWAGNHFIWCGVSNGIGGLNLTVRDGSSNLLAQATAYIKIVDIKQLYERWTVGDKPSVAPLTTAILATEGLAPGESGLIYPSSISTNTPYILLVHGYNMAPWEKDCYAETAYKRLYWQGYQGRFGAFNWPTAESALQFGASEIQAWNSAQGLLNKLNNLNGIYPGQVYLLAHSLGNVVASEALELAGSNQVVNTYISAQGAIASHTYDPNTAIFNLGAYYNGAPDCYAHYWTAGSPSYLNSSAGAGTYVNFFNTNDWALVNAWLLFQKEKPRLNPYYTYSSVTGAYYYTGTQFPTELFFPGDRYLLFANLIQAPCYALGMQPDVGGAFITGTNYNQVELNAAPYNFSTEHIYHSGEFRSDDPQRWQFWNQALIKMKLK